MAPVMPVSSVMRSGKGRLGFTSCEYSPASSPFSTRTAPISMIASFAGERPVGFHVHHHKGGAVEVPVVRALDRAARYPRSNTPRNRE